MQNCYLRLLYDLSMLVVFFVYIASCLMTFAAVHVLFYLKHSKVIWSKAAGQQEDAWLW